jgi:hypothetical protein
MDDEITNVVSADLSKPSTRTSSLYRAYIVTTAINEVTGVDSII